MLVDHLRCNHDDSHNVFDSLIHALKYPPKISFDNRVGSEESAHFMSTLYVFVGGYGGCRDLQGSGNLQ